MTFLILSAEKKLLPRVKGILAPMKKCCYSDKAALAILSNEVDELHFRPSCIGDSIK